MCKQQYIFKELETYKTIFYAWFEAMHTRIDLVLCNLSNPDALKVLQYITDEIKRIEKLGNYFDSQSEISQINQYAPYKSVNVSPEIFSILQDCIRFNVKTQGLFDITASNNCLSNIKNIELNETYKTVHFINASLRVDLSGYLKGYALDRIKLILIENKCFDALVNLGNSSIMALGNHPYGKGWKVKTNFDNIKNIEIELYNQFLTTSGNESATRKHIIDPHTGQFVKGTGAVSVVTSSGTDGEVLATALFINGDVSKIAMNDFKIL